MLFYLLLKRVRFEPMVCQKGRAPVHLVVLGGHLCGPVDGLSAHLAGSSNLEVFMSVNEGFA